MTQIISSDIGPGTNTVMSCYGEGCSGVAIPVTLGAEMPTDFLNELVPPFINFGRMGTYFCNPRMSLRLFDLSLALEGSGGCFCPKCGKLLDGAVAIGVIGDGTEDMIIFGHDLDEI